ncbi:unnamed protein product [Cyprideis torosa]|uniref:Uncharacterized protein n=1 Tax=Cyprideis torosa TaxID=163714 RepID=A0A7R8ZJ24_9CRUS|nr:unnamed protein product [Cyprideis torosa]CAG0878905.1 unnamed protein product [Cyprideis torosa]
MGPPRVSDEGANGSSTPKPVTCSDDQFSCGDGRCIPATWVCDYRKDCGDASDEKQNCPPKPCDPGQISCKTYEWGHKNCFAEYMKCDGVPDCSDGSDEEFCTYRQCQPDDHKCGSGICIPPEKICNGYYDCRDFSDEKDCNMTSCHLDKLRCEEGTRCIDHSRRCDHQNDCCPEPGCTSSSDEKDCGDGGKEKCISRDKVCDGKKDCDDGHDEEKACSDSKCPALGCEGPCVPSIDGGRCTCPEGKTLQPLDNRTCTDEDECLKWGSCDQVCKNTVGSYKCACRHGYTLSSDNRCLANDASSMRLYFCHYNTVKRMDPAGFQQEIIASAADAAGLDFHYEKSKLFWCDQDSKKVYVMPLELGSPSGLSRSKRDDRDATELDLSTAWKPVALAVDWVGNKLYVADSLGQKIDVFELDGRHHGIVLSHNLSSPSDVALDPLEGLMFISDGDRIVRSHMDGSLTQHIIKDVIYRVLGVAVDLPSKRIFWCDSLLDLIETSDYKGENRFTVLRGSTNVPSANRITVFERFIYWTDATKQGVVKVDKFNQTGKPSPIYRMTNITQVPKGIKAVHPLLQPSTPNPCGANNGNCEHMCIISRGTEESRLGYRCACSIGYQLSADLRTCQKITEFLLYSKQKFIKGIVLNPVTQGFNDAMIHIVSKSARFVGLEFDARKQYIYYSDVILDVIHRVHVNGTGHESLLASQHQGVEGLALDWISQNLYYVDTRVGSLNVLSARNNTWRRTLMTDLKRPRAIVVHPNRGQSMCVFLSRYLFISEWQRPASISRADLNGENRLIFQRLTLGWPNGLAIDYEEDRLYWCDAMLDHIQHSKLDGTDVKLIKHQLIHHAFSLAIHGDYIFVTDWRLDAIVRLHKTTGGEEEIVEQVEESNRLFGIKIFSEKLQKMESTHPCLIDNGGCEKFCFGVPKNSSNTTTSTKGSDMEAICGCPYGEVPQSDGKTCLADPEAEPSLKPCSQPTDFRCRNQLCIPKAFVCDGDNDCVDNSDEEQNCTKSTCAENHFKCDTGRCIPLSFKCDSDNDCGDFSDESGCQNVSCDAREFLCDNGRCILENWKCDSENDCGDGSDEGDFCEEKTCPYFQFTCPDSGHCISQSWVCDGDADCLDKSDEENCPPITCTASQFKCSNLKQCIHESYKCDGIQDCEDGSDELGCAPVKDGCNPDEQFRCKESGVCIPKTWHCDGITDCADASDESGECQKVTCLENYFLCNNSRCVFKTLICDGVDNCGDNSDEDARHACTPPAKRCTNEEWQCPSADGNLSVCIPKTNVCNGKEDCPGGLDEGPGCPKDEECGLDCEFGCFATPQGPTCNCPRGEQKREDNMDVCEDINECEPPGACSQFCENIKQSYICSCSNGYMLDADGKTCKAESKYSSQAFLIISNRRSLLVGGLTIQSLERVPVDVDNVVAAAADMENGAIFWSDMKSKKIMKLPKGEKPVTLVSSGLDLVEGLAYDWIAGNIYWVDSRLNVLEVVDSEGQNRVVLLSTNMSQPRGIAVDPLQGNRFLFWTDWGEHPRIERIALDGSNRKTIIDTKIFWPNGLTLDISTKKVFFADSKLDYIDYCDYDGTNRRQVIAANHYLLHPHSLAVFENKLFWTDRQLNRIISADKFTGENTTVVSHLVTHPLSVLVHHPVLQPKEPNPCIENPCDHLCLLAPEGRTCKCKAGYTKLGNRCILQLAPYLLVMKGAQIIDFKIDAMNGTSRGAMTPVVGVTNGQCIDYDREKATVYWIQRDPVFNGSIMRSEFGGGNVTSIFSSEAIGSPYALAFDWVGRNMYIANRGEQLSANIEVVKVDGDNSYRRIILANDGSTNGVSKPEALAVDPYEGLLFWLDEGGGGVPVKLAKVGLDGSNPTNLVLGIARPLALTLDRDVRRILFSTESPGTIQVCNYNGKQLTTLKDETKDPISRPVALAFHNDRLFIMDATFETLSRVDLPYGNNTVDILQNEDSLKAMAVVEKRRVPDNHPCVNPLECDHLCIPLAGSTRRCMCSTGFTEDSTGKCVTATSSFAIVSELNVVRGYSLDGASEAMSPIAGFAGHNILLVDYHFSKQWIYWVDFNHFRWNGIYRIRPNGTEMSPVITTGIGSSGIRGLAVDWTANNLYFTNVFQHETHVEVSWLDGSFRLVLKKTTRENPRTIAVNPVKRFLYFIDYGQIPKISRSHLDCSNWQAIVTTNIRSPRDLTIDMNTHDVYWVDSITDTLEKVSFKGSNRYIVRRNLPNPMGVAILGHTVYWIDRNLKTIFKASKIQGNGTAPIRVRSGIDQLRDIAIYDAQNQPPANGPCERDGNGRCQQLCFSFPPSATTDVKQTCKCATGVLGDDGLSCSSGDVFVVFSTRTELQSVFLDPTKKGVPFQPYKNLRNVVGVDFDAQSRRIYYTQIRPDTKIAYVDVDTMKESTTIMSSGINPEGIAYDWVARKIYWADSANSSIYAMNSDGTGVVRITNVDVPRAIVLHPCKGFMYFSDWGKFGTSGKIFRTTMAGNLKKTIVEEDLKQPSGLTIDYEDEKLYWTDAVREKIERSDLDGNNREVIVSATIYPFAVTIHGPYMYWTDLQLRGVYRADKYTGDGMIEMVQRLEESPRDIHVFSKDKQTCNSNPCAVRNGGCEYQCHPSANGTAECTCPEDQKLANEGRMCVNASYNCSEGKFTCRNGRCISRLWSCDTDNDCKDGSDEDEQYCAFHTCSPTEFRCINSRCIFDSWRCDHEDDCGDGSDEENCKYPPCGEGEFTCSNQRCIPNSQLCNGVNDCKDNATSDESLEKCAQNTTCPEGSFKCKSTNICAEPYWLCDGDNDCGDNSDESDEWCSQRTCPANSFRCPNNRCIPATWHCDGADDCGDGADEPPDYCNSESRTCFGDLFTCDNGNCIPRIYLCDGDNDCTDGSDEDTRHHCSMRECDPESEFTCELNEDWGRTKCIPRKWICDGDPDCVDGADENITLHGCPERPKCSDTQFTCTNGKCINQDWVCDNDNDCGDGSDEGKNCTYKKCPPDQFACENYKCIRTSYKCDGEDDCGDNSDEKDCTVAMETCQPGFFRCDNGQCIPESVVCNKEEDCTDGSDEPAHCNVNACLKVELHQCNHKCVRTLTGYKCECNEGYKLLKDGKACEDVNECIEKPGLCSQDCTNTPGSYYCKCNSTYYQRDIQDPSSCKRIDDITPWVLMSNKYYIRMLTSDGSRYSLIHQDLRNVVALDYDYKGDMLYFADVSAKTIYRSPFNQSYTENKEAIVESEAEALLEPIIRHESQGLEGLAVDWVGKKIYWLDRNSKQLDVAELNGTNRLTLKNTDISYPRAIVVHPGIGYLFFTDWQLHSYIGRIGMDGSDFKRILTQDDKVIWPNGLAIDYFSNKLFWADASLDYIAFSDFDGKHRQEVLTGHLVPHVFALTIMDDHVYWTDWNAKAVMRAHKFTGQNITVLRNTTHRPYDIQIYHPLRQLPYDNPCADNNGGCSHLCLLKPGANGTVTYSCACPNQFFMGSDGQSCIANCTAGQHRCGGYDDRCIPWFWKCDGEKDCADGSDEPPSCPPRLCPQGKFQCANNNCTSTSNICDMSDDCGDQSDESHCSAPCPVNQFKCKNRPLGRCMRRAWMCDGDNDCTDGSDEDPEICENRPCGEQEYQCKNGKCIPKLWKCDFDNDCGDDSDEPAHICRNTACREGWRRCPGWGNYRCIPKWLFCDGKDDCRDGSDELDVNCPACNVTTEFQCKNRRCIPIRWACDHSNDCGDNSDESPDHCEGKYRDCSESEFRCGDGKCIPRRWRCDHDEDCEDGSDEKNCQDMECKANEFQCASGHCLAQALRCNGIRDCRDMSDELDCPTRFPNGRYCEPSMFQCDNSLCVSQQDRCNGRNDCGDWSDEKENVCKNFNCSAVTPDFCPPDGGECLTPFRCGNGRCIPGFQVCDGINNCGDGTDENNHTLCAPKIRQCVDSEFKCSNHQCIDKSQLCDHRDDCGDMSDERGCHFNKTCETVNHGGCQQSCTNVEGGYVCHCDHGFVTSDKNPKHCDDIDECATMTHTCAQKCTNYKGGYTCDCEPGFEKVDNECRATEGDKIILFSNSGEINGLDIEQNRYFDVILDHRNAYIKDLDYDPVNEVLYWVDSVEKRIKRSLMPHGKRPEVQIGAPQLLEIKGVAKPTSLSVDWVGENIYWAEIDRSSSKSRGRIVVSKLDGRYRHLVIGSDLEMPSSVAVDPMIGRLFWSDVGAVPKIESANMDGSGRRVVVINRLGAPMSLAIDFAMNHTIFWADPKLNVIERVNRDGTMRQVIVGGALAKKPVSLDVFESWIYWISRETGELLMMDKFGRGVPVTLQQNIQNPLGLKVFQPIRYNTSSALMTTCKMRQCSHLCLLVPGGAACACPDNSPRIKATVCDAAFEPQLPLPLSCPCLNGGICLDSEGGKAQCTCPDGFVGEVCEHSMNPTSEWQNAGISAEAIAIPFIIIVTLLFAAGLFLVLKRGNFGKQVSQTTTPSVSFRRGTNVIFGDSSFVSNSKENKGQEPPPDITLGATGNRRNDFSNPMFDTPIPSGSAPSVVNVSETTYETGYAKTGEVLQSVEARLGKRPTILGDPSEWRQVLLGKNHEGRVKAKLDTLPLILTKNTEQKKKAEEPAEKKGEKEAQVPNEGNKGNISAAWTSADAALRAEILWVARRIMMGDSKSSISGAGDLSRKIFPDSEIASGFQMELLQEEPSSVRAVYLTSIFLTKARACDLVKAVSEAIDENLKPKVIQIQARSQDSSGEGASGPRGGARAAQHGEGEKQMEKGFHASKDLYAIRLQQVGECSLRSIRQIAAL